VTDRKRVIGVSYEPGEAAPVVVLKGSGAAADAVIDAAQARDDLPVVRDAALVDQLYRLPIDSAIGKELFPVMAVLLAHVLLVDRKAQEANP
jgi:type III secretion system FlhB-like substrate exporter